jgi:hypothetical protein
MSFAALDSKLRGAVPALIERINNGECRLMAQPLDGATDAQGYPNPTYSARTEAFLPCVWVTVSDAERGASEFNVAAAVRALIGYKVTVAAEVGGVPVASAASDRLELKRTIGGDAITLEVLAVLPNSNFSLTILAKDIDA